MVRVIQRPVTRTCSCQHCDSLLEYERSEIHTETFNFGIGAVSYSHIICPHCNKRVTVEASK